ncbi:sce7726 family protein [Vibrio europaeus]|uniref:Sce7726 family protein n=1 Tax=Vibrio europaeus TaxID=300876 RepID=A0AAE7ASG9_9VIBR|nr:sce7726 family protein [Vibrio europaeus]QJY35189.1 sce7726 family protein [Vibrio europaeus]
MSINAREVSKLFNSSKLSALADGDYSFVEKVASDLKGANYRSYTPAAIYESAYLLMQKEYRAEYYFKNTIANKILLGRHSLNTAVMLSEYRAGRSKADCVVVNGKTTCYEIKTEFDNLTRLEEQLKDYLALFDEVFVVCSSKHLSTVLSKVDNRVGVIELNSRNSLSVKREALQRKENIDVDLMIGSLRKDEYTRLIEKVTGEIPDVPNSLLVSTCRTILKQAEPNILATSFIDVLKEKRFNDASLINALPKVLVNAAISYQFSKKQSDSLKRIFNSSFKESQCICHTLEGNSLN